MSDGEAGRSLTGWLSRVGASLRGQLEYAELDHAADGAVHLSKALPRFFASMRSRSAPVLLDLGPVVGENVALLGDLLGCKVHIENVFGSPDRSVRDLRESEAPLDLPTRFPHPDNSVDGVLCWDVLDYLPQKSADAVVADLRRMLKPGGVAMAIFATIRSEFPRYLKYVMIDEQHLCHRSYPAVHGPERIWSSRGVQLLLAEMEIGESFLLTHRQRETLFHKPLSAASTRR